MYTTEKACSTSRGFTHFIEHLGHMTKNVSMNRKQAAICWRPKSIEIHHNQRIYGELNNNLTNERMGRVGFTLDDLGPQNPQEFRRKPCGLWISTSPTLPVCHVRHASPLWLP
ncbi:hypothetical protein PVAP13_7KG081267 [Panicum virgatum]|uniref:Uncharacterized protein n=1 Tax=Panicum virgatum TaxID=38727 RepID=A0A8T0QCU1_PANVG|nr:hypothetical protein PVAP13_7KG081267 [Panicum virgatum]